MASKFDGDVRPLSNDPRYMGVVFTGKMANAIKQAKAAPDHGLPERHPMATHGIRRNRAVLLEHLNLLKAPMVGFDVGTGATSTSLKGLSDPLPKDFFSIGYARRHGFI
jgi:hypothetical protein